MGRRRRERQSRIEEIIDAAEAIMFSKGYERTTFVEIAKKTKFSRSSLYKYFRNKEEVFLAVHLRGLNLRWELIKSAIDAETTGVDKLFAYGDAYFKFAQKYPEYIKLQLYWDAFGIDTDKIRKDLFDEYSESDKQMRGEIRKIFISVLSNKASDDFFIDWSMGHWLFSLRAVANQAINPLDITGIYNDPEFYYQYVRSFIRSLTAFDG
jgi:AcrR family transcriptional regulator